MGYVVVFVKSCLFLVFFKIIGFFVILWVSESQICVDWADKLPKGLEPSEGLISLHYHNFSHSCFGAMVNF